MQDTFLLNFDISYREYAGSLLRYLLKSKYLKLFLVFMLILSVVSLLLGFVTSTEANLIVSLISSLAPIVILLFFAPFLFLVFTAIIYFSNSPIFKPVNIEFNHWGVNRLSDRINLSKPWREIVKAEETKTAFHIYVSKNDFIIIPKRAFKDEIEMNNFGYFLSTKTEFKL
ncbi:YcxB family protein [Lacibacter luteus]|uniref:YcxB family protein n=1 Tax=Lacibacter luteus TaxID=2508719 RepID=A0A4Q1CF04_9BACT|nr:YcxB family protein [Lacibacter luteus]RXK58157.1 YcxB family protein [Lacibacter luteus]